jgi:hypothetical protein
MGGTMDAIAVLNRIVETYLHAFEAERGEVLSKADKNLMKHAFDDRRLHQCCKPSVPSKPRRTIDAESDRT